MKNFFKKLMSSKSQSKYFSETVQRVGKNNAGFSLVELIVVIAIMAILAAVAVIGVSIYIPKAQKAADQQLVSDVIDALKLQYYQNEGAGGGFVILTREGVVLDASQRADEFGAAAMEAVFGAEWAQKAVLQYEWNANLSDSSATTIEANKILETASSLTGVAAAVVGGNTPSSATGIIYSITGDAALRTELEQYESDPNYSTIAANLLVKHLSGEIGNAELDENGELTSELSGASTLTLQYALLYSMANSDNAYSNAASQKLKLFDEAMEKIAEEENKDSNFAVMQSLENAWNEVQSGDVSDDDGQNTISFEAAYEQYIASNFVTDMNGIIDAMGFVNSTSQEYSDAESLSNPDLFGSDAIANKLADYQNANKYGIVIRIDENGEITVLPEDAGIFTR